MICKMCFGVNWDNECLGQPAYTRTLNRVFFLVHLQNTVKYMPLQIEKKKTLMAQARPAWEFVQPDSDFFLSLLSQYKFVGYYNER